MAVEEAIYTILAADGTVGPLISTHGLTVGDAITFTTTNTLPTSAPAGFAAGTTYYAGTITGTTFKVYTTAALAIAGGVGTEIDFTDTGTGIHTVYPTGRRWEWFTATVDDATDIWTATRYRITPQIVPANSLMPAIAYQRISPGRIRSLGGASGMAHPRIQLSSWAVSYSGAKALADAVRVALDDYKAITAGWTIHDAYTEGEIDLFDAAPELDTERRYGVAMDFFVWHNE